jgi:hypothetical protein
MQLELLADAIARRRRSETYEQAVLLRMAQVEGQAFERFLRKLRGADGGERTSRPRTLEEWEAMGVKVHRPPGEDDA